MSIDARQGRYCDQCGRTIAKAARVYQSRDYCNTCYQRVFPHFQCVKCGTPVRRHEKLALPHSV